MSGTGTDYRELALAFTKALATRNYHGAYGLTSSEYRRHTSLAGMQSAFEAIVPPDWQPAAPAGDDHFIQVGLTMEEWPDREPSDVGWAYVSVGGETYSEAVIVIVSAEGGALVVRKVEFGRP